MNDLHRDPARVEQAARIAFGTADRTDDDHYVPLWETAASGRWALGVDADPRPTGFRGLLASQGHELKRLGDQAGLAACETWTPGETRAETLWFVAQGDNVLLCTRAAPVLTDKPPYEDESARAARKAAWHDGRQALRLITLHAGANADYLWLALADNVFQADVRCRAAKSYWHPSVSVSVLADSLIPSPPAATRAEAVRRYNASAELIASREIRSLLEEIQGSLDGKERAFDRPAAPVAGRVLTRTGDFMADAARQVHELLAPLASGAAASSKQEDRTAAPPPSYPPAPGAIARRKRAHEHAGGRRIRAALDLAQMSIEFDAAVTRATETRRRSAGAASVGGRCAEGQRRPPFARPEEGRRPGGPEALGRNAGGRRPSGFLTAPSNGRRLTSRISWAANTSTRRRERKRCG